MNLRRRSKIWSISSVEFATVVNNSKSLADILRFFNLHVGAANYITLRKRIAEENIDISHIPLGLASNAYRNFKCTHKPIEDIFSKDTELTAADKRIIRKTKTLGDTCSICKLTNEWNGQFLQLQIDHRDGNRKNNLQTNLRLLCPNCHSQTKTFAGRNSNK